MSNGTFLKPNSASDLPWRFVMHDRWAIYLFLLFINILCVHRHRSGFECDPAKTPQWISGIDNMRPNQILGRKGTEPRAQSPGIWEGQPARCRHMGSKGWLVFDAWSGFDVRTDHLLIIHCSGRSQGRTLTSVCVWLAELYACLTRLRDRDSRGQLQKPRG